MSKVLVTGANGFLGSWVVKGLISEGHEVTALVRKGSDIGSLENLDYQCAYGDVTNLSSLEAAFKGQEAIFHLAGVIAYRASKRALMEKVNVEGTKNVLVAAAKADVTRLVHLSSVVAIGAGFTSQQILNEESTYNISNLNLGYFETKKAAEELVRSACQQRWVDAVILNPSTIYGSGDARKGSRGNQLKVAQGRMKFYPPGGVNVIAVEDAVFGILSAWKKGVSGERYILGGDNLLIKDLFAMIAKEAHVQAPNIPLPSWFLHSLGFIGDQMEKLGMKGPLSGENAWASCLYHWFDNSKAKEKLGLNPKPAQYAIAKSVQWMRENGLLENKS